MMVVRENIGIAYENFLDPAPRPAEYGEDYWQKYQKYKGTAMSYWLTEARTELVGQFEPKTLLDIGIGNGDFLESLQEKKMVERPKGYDINPVAKKWLQDRGQWCLPLFNNTPEAVTMWDSLEHLIDAGSFVAHLYACGVRWVFVSIPIFNSVNPEEMKKSRHWRPGEHLWYFTEQGLANLFAFGYDRIIRSDMEIDAGRDSIMTYVFQRRETGGDYGLGKA
jgi:hypothetical protein